MKIDKKLILLILVVLSVGAGILVADFSVKEQEEQNPVSEGKVESQSQLIIDKGEDIVKREVNFQSGATVFDVLEKSGVEFDYEKYEGDVFINAIDGLSNATRSWIYYINREIPSRGVNHQQVETGDVVKFKYQEPSF